MKSKLNLGCGLFKESDYINIDIRKEVNPDLVHDVTNGLPFKDNSMDEVRAFDFLEHIYPESVPFVMEEIWRVLKHGGTFGSRTPDAEHGQGAFMDPSHVSFWTEGKFDYYTDPVYRNYYGTKVHFTKEHFKRTLTDAVRRVYHLNFILKAVKNV